MAELRAFEESRAEAKVLGYTADEHYLQMQILYIQILLQQFLLVLHGVRESVTSGNSFVRHGATWMYRFSTGFAYFITKVVTRYAGLFERDLAAYGFTVPMYRVVAGLWEKGDQQLSELSAMTNIELSTLSRMIGAMKRNGFVSRARLESDERSIRLNLTAKGRALAPKLMAIATRYEDFAVQLLGEDEMANVRQNLAKLYQNLEQLERPAGGAVSPPRRRAPRAHNASNRTTSLIRKRFG
jgi:MarR family transcriptional regulator, organic hydroperoxide resistance regulator